jgi:transcriptional antiterminator RfaH
MTTMHRWFAIRTKPNKEFFAKKNLEMQDITVYLPVIEKLTRHARKIKKVQQPFFKGYLFAQLEPDTTNWTSINSTYGVAGIVRFGNRYPAVPDSLIERLKGNEDEKGHIIIPDDYKLPFKKGSKVSVRVGEADMEGIFFGMDGETRARILIELLSNQQEISVPVVAVSKA